jgi:hypothetical protein
MTQLIKVCYRNILENSTITVSSENAAFPKYRLYDRDITKLFKFNAADNPSLITLDQGTVTSYPVSRLFIPVGHTLNGLACKLQYSATGAWAGEEVDALSWTQGDALRVDKAFAEQTKRYWRLRVAAPGAPIELPEMFLTKPYQFARNVSWGYETGDRLNIERQEALSGKAFYVENGVPRKERIYSLTKIQTAQKTELETWQGVTHGVKAVYVEDELTVVFFAEVIGGFRFANEREGRWGAAVHFLEFI